MVRTRVCGTLRPGSNPGSHTNESRKKFFEQKPKETENVDNTGFEYLEDDIVKLYIRKFKIGKHQMSISIEKLKNGENSFDFGFGFDDTPILAPMIGFNSVEKEILKMQIRKAIIDFAKLYPNEKLKIYSSDAIYTLEDYKMAEDHYREQYELLVGKNITLVDGTKIGFYKNYVSVISNGEELIVPHKDLSVIYDVMQNKSLNWGPFVHIILNNLVRSKTSSEQKQKQRLKVYYRILKELFGDAVEGVDTSREQNSLIKFEYDPENDQEFFLLNLRKINDKFN